MIRVCDRLRCICVKFWNFQSLYVIFLINFFGRGEACGCYTAVMAALILSRISAGESWMEFIRGGFLFPEN